VHFRKQVAIGPYVVDFACHHLKLVIEVDGDSHFTERGIAQDAARDAFLKARGFVILRFTNDDVMNNAEGVFAVLAKFIEEQDA
jgi:very-short-patch-repair endonuclease